MRIGLLAPLVTPICEPQLGGSQALLADLSCGLAARGHQVAVVASSGSRIDGVTVIDSGVDAEQLAATLYRHGGPDPDAAVSRRAFDRAWDCIRDGGFDLVHNHAFDVPAIEVSRAAPVPVLHTLHLPPARPMVAALRASGKHPRPPVVAAVSESQAQAWRRLVRIDVVLRNGVPVHRIPFGPRATGALLFAGRFSPEKGARDAIDVALKAGAELTLVGGTYDPEYAARHVLPFHGRDGIRIQAALPRQGLWEHMAQATAVLCPIRWDEPFGLVAAEAQACGTPVVGYARGGLLEVVARGTTGILVAEGDVDAAAAAVSDAAALDRRGCRVHAEATLDISATLDAHEALYQRMLTKV